MTKLCTLTLVSLAYGDSELQYAQLREASAVSTIRQVEDVVIDAVYAGLLRARMNQQAGTVEVSAVEGRDVVILDGIEPMVNSLNGFLNRAGQVVSEIDSKIEFIATDTNRAKEQKQSAAVELHAVHSQIRAESSRNVKRTRLRNKKSDVPAEEDVLHFYRRDTRSMRARRCPLPLTDVSPAVRFVSHAE
ncbi:COP9 signalosome complex subunit 7 [Gracilariopsis chorda]|uniref:COP9 signalosome complex subunit 7 n=1 Tax=Gracilariopsis chorda TaxID=448386 RepID=A0A2V3IK51_9FLOR|nr:COP9 signalosome complex subunit 7 [Gracilariopsis chorda]|eukprot:PXF42423.1 COP9 signalosome complex subunit 7 [Gracilariopsis chorda]